MSFVSEIKRRNVFKVALAYAALSWLLIEIVTTVERPLSLPEGFDTIVIVLLVVGFPVALLLAWAYELTPGGVKRTENVPASESITHKTGQKLNHVVITLLALAVITLVLDNYVLEDGIGGEEATIAVLNVRDLSADPEQENYVDGLAYEIHASLSYDRRSDTDFLVTAEFTDASSDETRWRDSYEHNAQDPRDVLTKIVNAVSERLSATFGYGAFDRTVGGSEEPGANNEFFMAQGLLHESGGLPDSPALEAAIDSYRSALEIDPDFGRAQLGLAMAIFLQRRYDPEGLGIEFHDALAEARRLMPDDPEIALLDSQLALDNLDWITARQLLDEHLRATRGRSWAGHFWMGNFLVHVGRAREALPHIERAVELNPLFAPSVLELAKAYEVLGEDEKVIEAYERAKGLEGYSAFGYGSHFWKLMALGDMAAADRLVAEYPNLAGILERLDAYDEGLPASELDSDPRFYSNAASLRGHVDRAFELRAKLLRSSPSYLFSVWAAGSPIRQHEDFEFLMRQLGLVDYWMEYGWPEHCRPSDVEGFDCD